MDKLSGSELYSKQWGQPTHDDTQLFYLLTVGTFQAGLSWKMVTNKREVFLRNFHNMSIRDVAGMTEADVDNILNDPEMIRNYRKIMATVINAQAIVKIQAEYGSFARYLWEYVEGRPREIIYTHSDEISNVSPFASIVAKDLKKRGFKFVGPVVTYMFLKASGIVKDIVIDQ
ncbi:MULTISPECIES: DNA-3-methyladenine glycosylase I [Brochothrix]|uniref:DNA-3-methyladenine glycosylase n=1 Tax=Brochothrix thermosphacta TaxID=2756 RepID=A0A1D2JX38_BROTH|nr:MULTISPECIES: DNA-3-methyladenine glycosylase I [Brochothrix]ANZ94434.1 DNA-3-methyladenine glycosylase [Brochothrix thermosphacta]ATF26699.1 DNA-3-methyladenine glycosylase I [Brochothrix thermosphacta]ATH86054.1 DNA-3-methyladenine glycosylase I [Brochothrix thermosphacta]MBR5527329.1 DNA-3-methyladenine glycosylase I [Brochothrix sp.]MPQ29237.1 DNA-3-methyladenine glycosylase I [Brochothrix thermosphacta]